MKLVTAWFVVPKEGEPQFNHIEDGHSKQFVPANPFNIPAWKNTTWCSQWGYLDAQNKLHLCKAPLHA